MDGKEFQKLMAKLAGDKSGGGMFGGGGGGGGGSKFMVRFVFVFVWGGRRESEK